MDRDPRPSASTDRLRALSQLSFPAATNLLLGEFIGQFGAERGFFLLWSPPGPEEQDDVLIVVQALTSGGEIIDHPDYHLDRHYLREIGRLDGARALPSPEEGVGRSLLSCSLALDSGARGIVLLEGPPGGRSFDDLTTGQIEEEMAEVSAVLHLLHRLSTREQELDRLRDRTLELGKQLDYRELDLGSVQPTTDEANFQHDDVAHYQEIVTRSAKMKELFAVIERIKNADINALITGETGTGKELIARAIHFGSKRAGRPFEAVACGSLAVNLIESELFGYRKGAFSGAEADKKGVFERAQGGTVFLDEVADMPTEMQQKILRVLQERVIRPVGATEEIAVDVRVISSTQRDLMDLVKKQQFREDLYYRLNVIALEVPPLRDRREDIVLLLDHFLRERIEEEEVTRRFSESAARELYQYAWPGNIQELKNLVTRAFLSSSKKIISRRVVMPLLANQAGNLFYGKEIYQEGEHLHLSIPCREGFNEIIAECEKLILLTALRRNRGNKSRVTQQLGIPRQTLYNKLEKYGILEEDYMTDD